MPPLLWLPFVSLDFDLARLLELDLLLLPDPDERRLFIVFSPEVS